MDRRRLYLKLGYRSLFAYCTDALEYSESSAGRRVQAARAIRRFPVVTCLLERGEVNLSTVAKVAGIALSEGDSGIFERIRGMTQDQAAAVASEYRPQKRPRDRVRPVSVRVEPAASTPPVEVPLAKAPAHSATGSAAVSAKVGYPRSGVGALEADMVDAPGAVRSRSGSATTASEQEPDRQTPEEQAFEVRFVAGADLMRAIEQVRALLSFRLPANAPMEEVLAILTGEFIERHSPDRRRARRRKRNATRGKREECGERAPRYVPAAVRDEAFVRAGGRCTFTAPDGTRCSATRHLQVDHIVPVARGGRGSGDNVRVLCAAHNRLEAERILGAATMAQFARRE